MFTCQVDKEYNADTTIKHISDVNSIEECQMKCCLFEECSSINYESATKTCLLLNIPTKEITDKPGMVFCMYGKNMFMIKI